MPELIDRAEGLDVHEVPDGYIIYQTARDKVHYLNKTAAVIFEFCDGQHGKDDIVSRVATAFELAPRMHDEVSNCLDSLIGEGLLLRIQK